VLGIDIVQVEHVGELITRAVKRILMAMTAAAAFSKKRLMLFGACQAWVAQPSPACCPSATICLW
jgi:hypothetical protein